MWAPSGNINAQSGIVFTNQSPQQSVQQIAALRKHFEIKLMFSLSSPLQTRYVEEGLNRLSPIEKNQITLTMDMQTSTVTIITLSQKLVQKILELALESERDKSVISHLMRLIKITRPTPGFVMT
jgi:hypothetical protein